MTCRCGRGPVTEDGRHCAECTGDLGFPGDLTSAEGAAWLPRHAKAWATRFMADGGEVRPMAILLCKRNPNTGLSFAKPQPIPVAVANMDGEEAKEATVRTIRKLAAKGRAFGVAWMTESWGLKWKPSKEENEAVFEDYRRNWVGRLSEHPDRIELVTVTWQHRAVGSSGSSAEIIRDAGAPPRLGPWSPDATDCEGRFVDFLPREDS